MINENPKYLIEDNLIIFESSLDIVEFKCEVPGLFQIHFIDDIDSDNRQINLLSKVYTFLPRMTDFTISPVINTPQEDINFEIYNPNGAKIKINDGKNITYIDSNNKYYQIKYKNDSEVPYLFTVLSNKDTVISISLSNKNNFAIVDTEYSRIGANYSQVIVKLLQKENCESINIEISKVYYGYNYSFFKGNVDYAASLVESESDYIEIDRSYRINIYIPNPYLGEEIKDENISYYFMFYIEDHEKIQKDVKLTYNEKKEYEIINKEIPKIIFKENEKYQLPTFEENSTDINILYQSCGNSLKQINIYNYEDQIKTIENNKIESIYQHDSFEIYNNLSNLSYRLDILFNESQKDIDPFLNGAVIGITEQNITDEDIHILLDGKSDDYIYYACCDMKEISDRYEQTGILYLNFMYLQRYIIGYLISTHIVERINQDRKYIDQFIELNDNSNNMSFIDTLKELDLEVVDEDYVILSDDSLKQLKKEYKKRIITL